MIEYFIYIILGVIFVEFFLRAFVSIFINKSYKSIFSIQVPLWKVFINLEKLNKKTQ